MSALLPRVPEPTQPYQCRGLLWDWNRAKCYVAAVWGQEFAHRCVGPGQSRGMYVSLRARAQGWPGSFATTYVTLGGGTRACPLILQVGFPGGLLPSFPTLTHLGQLSLPLGS